MLLLLVSVQKMNVPVWLLVKVSRDRIFSNLSIRRALTFPHFLMSLTTFLPLIPSLLIPGPHVSLQIGRPTSSDVPSCVEIITRSMCGYP